MKKNKIVILTVIGVVAGGLIGFVDGSEQENTILLAGVGGAVGFLAGWIWDSRSGESKE